MLNPKTSDTWILLQGKFSLLTNISGCRLLWSYLIRKPRS